MKLYAGMLFGLAIIIGLLYPSVSADTMPKMIVVERVDADITAYYKPLPDQDNFLTGSYKRDVRLNGRGVTFSGERARIGHVAADPNVFPIGTLLKIPGYGLAVVKDIGGSITGNRIDLFMGEGDEGLKKSIEWGRKDILIEVVRRGC